MTWPFDQPANCVTMTTAHVMRDGAPITRAYHNEDGWQFLSEHVTRMQEALLVGLGSIVSLDPSIAEIADLPPGWFAQREAPGSSWHRKLQYADATKIVLDWSQVSSEDDFYDQVLPQCGAPSWHGRNLDALADSWVTGGIDRLGPPYAFEFLSSDAARPELISFRDAVLRIARESIEENGGRYIPEAEPRTLPDQTSGP